ncbi:unnamed protein product [Larinioides sclopetarius]|uniref:Uncharacterized protein n=1 Tax=Larinioides sclopetarius TaxID=280406 RepID=A0AAV2A459_9ARAC
MKNISETPKFLYSLHALSNNFDQNYGKKIEAQSPLNVRRFAAYGFYNKRYLKRMLKR